MGFKFGGLALDSDSQSDHNNANQESPAENSEEEMELPKPVSSISKPKGLASLQIQDDENE